MRDVKQIRSELEVLLVSVLPAPMKLLYAGKIRKLVDLLVELAGR